MYTNTPTIEYLVFVLIPVNFVPFILFLGLRFVSKNWNLFLVFGLTILSTDR